MLHKDDLSYILDSSLDKETVSGKLEHVIAFAAFLFTGKKLRKETVGNYLSGVKHTLASYGKNVEFFSNIAVTKILAGMHLRDVAGGKTPDQKKPFPLEMTRFMIEVLLRQDTMAKRLVRVAALMAYFMLLRQSEYIYSPNEGSHALLARNVEFKFLQRNEFVSASQVRGEAYEQVESVRITLPHCKNDPFHRGNSLWYEARKVRAGEYDIVSELFQWSKVARFASEDVFTSI
jgi:hypothetical protein